MVEKSEKGILIFENKKNVIAVFTRKVAQDAELDVLTERRGKVSKET